MSTLVITQQQFPNAVRDVHVGDTLTFTVTATVQKIEGDLIDIQSLGGKPEVTLGLVEVAFYITDIEREGEER